MDYESCQECERLDRAIDKERARAKAAEAERDRLREALGAVIERLDRPYYRNHEAMADAVKRLRRALAPHAAHGGPTC